MTHIGKVVLTHTGTIVLIHIGTIALTHIGTVVLTHIGAVVLTHIMKRFDNKISLSYGIKFHISNIQHSYGISLPIVVSGK